ncbi:hypothetical protein D3C80_1323790 [compost metagenome]
MTGFMHHAKQRAQQFVFVVTGSDADIFRDAAAERMRTHIQTTRIKIEAQHLHGFQAELTLHGGRERPLRRNKGLLRLLFHHAGEQIREPGFQITKHVVQTGAGHIRFKDIEQRIIRGAAFRFGTQARLLTAEFDDVLQIGGKTLPVVGRALRTPGVFTFAPRQRFGFHQRLRQ